jgi:hypothetical protein
VLVELAERLDVPMADVIREALSLFWWFARERAAGSRILIQRGDQVTELLIPSLEELSRAVEPHAKTKPAAKQPDAKSIRASA